MMTADQAQRLTEIKGVVPVDVAAAARLFGLEIYATKLAEGVSGVLLKDASYNTPSGFVIFVDQDESAVRQRFSAAHEIGHFVHHRAQIGDRLEDNYLLRAAGMSNRQEAEANRFAADLLMPRDIIAREMDAGHRTLEQLADRFNVSRVAMGIRLGLPT